MASSARGRCLLQPLLEKANMSQSELARRTGISQRMISYYASDKKRMSVDSMRAISIVLNCRMEDLYEWVD